jgi:hypothetical protein
MKELMAAPLKLKLPMPSDPTHAGFFRYLPLGYVDD